MRIPQMAGTMAIGCFPVDYAIICADALRPSPCAMHGANKLFGRFVRGRNDI
jgi:hypothetical protein